MTTTNKFALELIQHIEIHWEHFAIFDKLERAVEDFHELVKLEYPLSERIELHQAMNKLATQDLYAIQVAINQAINRYESF